VTKKSVLALERGSARELVLGMGSDLETELVKETGLASGSCSSRSG
jgi:hypothetical protein